MGEGVMKLSELSTGPDWIIWIFVILLGILSIVLLSGHGSWLIAGYNTASKEEKAKYNGPRVCRIVGGGMAVIALLLLVMGLFENMLPAVFAYISIGIILGDIFIVMILINFFCKV